MSDGRVDGVGGATVEGAVVAVGTATVVTAAVVGSVVATGPTDVGTGVADTRGGNVWSLTPELTRLPARERRVR